MKESSPLRKDVRRKMLIEEIDPAIVQAHHLQISRDEFFTMAISEWKYSKRSARQRARR